MRVSQILFFPGVPLIVMLTAGRLDAKTTDGLATTTTIVPEGITSWTTKPHAVYHNRRTYYGYQNQRHVEVNYRDQSDAVSNFSEFEWPRIAGGGAMQPQRV